MTNIEKVLLDGDEEEMGEENVSGRVNKKRKARKMD